MTKTFQPLVGPEALSPEWLALRKYNPQRKTRPIVFGATKAAGCCGLSPYTTPLEVFVECLHGLEKETTEAMEFGRDFESAVLNIYQRKRKVRLARELPMYFHPEHPFMGATPDAIVIEDEKLAASPVSWLHAVDAKTSTYRRLDKEGSDPLKFGREGTDELPVDYVMQGQQQCAVLGLPFVEFPVLFSRDFCPIYRVERNDDLIQCIVKAEREMLDRLVNNDPPEPNWTHENTRTLIGILHGHKEDVVTQLDAQDVDDWLQVQRLKDAIKESERVVLEITNKLLWKLQGASAGVFPSGQAQLKRIVVKETLVTAKDVADLEERIGQRKRAGYEFLKQTKVA